MIRQLNDVADHHAESNQLAAYLTSTSRVVLTNQLISRNFKTTNAIMSSGLVQKFVQVLSTVYQFVVKPSVFFLFKLFYRTFFWQYSFNKINQVEDGVLLLNARTLAKKIRDGEVNSSCLESYLIFTVQMSTLRPRPYRTVPQQYRTVPYCNRTGTVLIRYGRERTHIPSGP